jgi:RHS repeat-associated protein
LGETAVPDPFTIHCSQFIIHYSPPRVSGDPETTNNGLFYLHSDHLNSATFLTHGNGHASEGLKKANSTKFFTPFGEYRIDPPDPADDITDRGFTGHKHNDDIKLIYMGARWYLPETGRFLSADSIVPNPANPQSFNRFSYVNNRPLNLVDPTGHNGECPDDDCYTPPAPPTPPPVSEPEPQPEDCFNLARCDYELPPPHPRDPLTLEQWEIDLITMIAYYETHGEGQEQFELVFWIILNRFADGTYDSVEDLIWSNQYHIAFGDPDDPDSKGLLGSYLEANPDMINKSKKEIAIAAYNRYKTVAPRNLTTIPEWADQSARGVLTAYNSGQQDPTGGARYFAHTSDPLQAEVWKNSLLERGMGLNTAGYFIGAGGRYLVYNKLFPPYY